jgi:hypothetical protein
LKEEFGWFNGRVLGLGVDDIADNLHKEADAFVDRLFEVRCS